MMKNEVIQEINKNYYVIIDNFMEDPTYVDKMEQVLLHPDNLWRYLENPVVVEGQDVGTKYACMHQPLYHTLDGGIQPSSHFFMFVPVIDKIKEVLSPCDTLYRARAYLTFSSPETTPLQPHVDEQWPNISCVFYISDADGDTILYKEHFNENPYLNPDKLTEVGRVPPKKNRLVLFRGDRLHSAGIPAESTRRLIANINFELCNEE